MTLHKFLSVLFPTAGAICLAAGYALAGQTIALVCVGLVWLAWLLGTNWPPSVMLVATVGLAAGGLYVGASPFLMLPAATLALVSWDWVRWQGFLGSSLSAEAQHRLEQKHAANLALAVGPALLVALAGRFIHFQIPFGILVALTLLALLGLDRIWTLVKR